MQLIRVILESSSEFKYISGIQPFLMSFAGKKYYVYVKNVSSAYFKDRGKTTRAQLPIRPEFEDIKTSDIPFIFLGYDADNDVLICWNFHIVKKRLNAARSVSFYSRTYFQEEVKQGEFLIRVLKNGDRPVLFKRRDLIDFFSKIDTFFPDDIQKTVSQKNIPEATKVNYQEAFKRYFDLKNLSQKTCTNYTQALLGRISDGISYYILNEPINVFFYNDIPLLEDWKDRLFKTPEYADLDERGKHMYSCAFEKYIQFHKDCKEYDPTYKASENSTIAHTDSGVNCIGVDMSIAFKGHLLNQGKSDDVIQMYIDILSGRISLQISHLLHREVNIFSITDVELIQDWLDQLIQDHDFRQENISQNRQYTSSLNKYIEFLDDQIQKKVKERNTDNESPLLFNDGEEYEEPIDHNGKLLRITDPELLSIIKPLIQSNRNLSAAQEVGKFYSGKYPSMTLTDWMNLIKGTSITDFDLVNNKKLEIPPNSMPEGKKKKMYILKVTFPNGDIVQDRVVAKTFVRVIEYAGVEKVLTMGITMSNVNLISATIVTKYAACQKPIGNGLYVMTGCSTETKLKIIQQISDTLGLNLRVEKIPIV
ncbi:MAG: hypothetical protein LIO79_00475 [Rikenellaceae bacterium]|nr:hypothetical protein [Rikenellaceae bacterium]